MKKILFLFIVLGLMQSCVSEYRSCPSNDKNYFYKQNGVSKPKPKFNKPY